MTSSERVKKLLRLPFAELVRIADHTRAENSGSKLDICTILNAKSGSCSEDCKFCAQSCRHATGIETYPLRPNHEIFAAAVAAKKNGAGRFGIVTSGNVLTGAELHRLADCISDIKSKIGIKVCASLGKLGSEDLKALKRAGLSRYHHNIETSPRYFKKIVTTHTFGERLETISAAQSAGLEVCSGGIIGMGEGWQDRIEMAVVLKDLGVDSVPVNILVPVDGTPLAGSNKISCTDAIRAIAIFRIILKDKTVKIAAGRESVLKDFQASAFMAGANGMLIGGYLTVRGREVAQDLKLIDEIKALWKR
ncbi:MAG: biotin synthase BioB [Candidatus Omnitrophica bacterium]|nr:biotin synthase BioB [Candidatus Omnitrophota bacterium]